MKRINLFLLVLLGIGLLHLHEIAKGQTASAPTQKVLRLGFVANNANDYWALVRRGCDASISGSSVVLDFRTPTEHTAAAQQEILSNLIARGVDGIAISPIDAESQTAFLNSIPTNILLVCADSDAENSRGALYIGTDNIAAGTEVAKLLKTALPEGGKILLFVGYPNAQNAKERIQGIQAGLAGSKVQIVDTLVDQGKSALTQKMAQDALTKYPDVAGMVGLNSYNGPAVLLAVSSAGKLGHVKIVCFDDDSDTLAGIAAGDIYGTIVQKPFAIGRQTITTMVNYLRGDQTQLTAGKILLPPKVITKSEVAAYQNTLKNMRE